MLVLFYGAGISFILLVGRPIPPTWIKEFVRVFLCPEFKMNLSLKIQMMKNAIIFAKCHSIAELLQKTLLLILLIPIASSCEKEGGSQPDPPGTITQNMAEDYEYPVGISLAGVYSWHACTLSWTTPSTIWVDGYRNMYTDGVSINPSDVAICSLGKVKGLGAITSIPESGFTPMSYRVNTALEAGCGYVVKCETYADLKGYNIAPKIYTTHIKLYAEQVGVSSAKVHYQVLQ